MIASGRMLIVALFSLARERVPPATAYAGASSGLSMQLTMT